MVHTSLEPQPGGTVMVTPCSWYARDPEGIPVHSALNHWPLASISSKYPVLNEQIGEWEGKKEQVETNSKDFYHFVAETSGSARANRIPETYPTPPCMPVPVCVLQE